MMIRDGQPVQEHRADKDGTACAGAAGRVDRNRRTLIEARAIGCVDPGVSRGRWRRLSRLGAGSRFDVENDLAVGGFFGGEDVPTHGPPAEGRRQQGPDDRSADEVREVFHQHRHLGLTQMEHVPGGPEWYLVDGQTDTRDDEEQSGLVMALSTTALRKRPFAVEDVGQNRRDQDRKDVGRHRVLRQNRPLDAEEQHRGDDEAMPPTTRNLSISACGRTRTRTRSGSLLTIFSTNAIVRG